MSRESSDNCPLDVTLPPAALSVEGEALARVGVPSRPPFAPSSVADRLFRKRAALVTFVGSGSLLGVAAYLTPAVDGHGTHQQLGLPACGWVVGFGIPCPTCGMTTAYACAADGDLISSFLCQPMGCLLALATAATALVSLYVAVTGSAIGGHLLRQVTPKVGWWIAGLVVAAWVYKLVTFH
jgi:hypothetical protein